MYTHSPVYLYSGDLLLSGEGHSDWLSSVQFHPDGGQLASTSGDGTVKLWDFEKASCISTLTEHQQPGGYNYCCNSHAICVPYYFRVAVSLCSRFLLLEIERNFICPIAVFNVLGLRLGLVLRF